MEPTLYELHEKVEEAQAILRSSVEPSLFAQKVFAEVLLHLIDMLSQEGK